MEAATFTIIGEPTRLRILDALRDGAQAVGDLVERLNTSQPTVSKHLRILREAGFVRCRVDAQRRIYELNSAPFGELDAWLQTYMRTWNTSFDRLEQLLEEERSEE